MKSKKNSKCIASVRKPSTSNTVSLKSNAIFYPHVASNNKYFLDLLKLINKNNK